MAVFDPQARLALRDTHVLCLEVQEPWAAALVRGTKTIETRRYALPAWARGVDVDEPFHRVAAGSPYDWDGGEKHGWVVASARAVAPLPSPPLVRKFRSFYEPVAGATLDGPSGGAFAVVAGGRTAEFSLASIRGRPSVPVPSGKHKDKLAASVSAVISMCPDAWKSTTASRSRAAGPCASRTRTASPSSAGPCGSDTPADLKNVVRLELLP
ncbi:phosphatase [Aureococcus anophagefferens]|nr:phosphatase [Aureococcus anophagefferens]